VIDTLARFIQPLVTRVANTVARAVIKNVDDSKKLQLLQLAILSGETRDEVEHFQNYGFTSHPKAGAEVVIVCVGGRRDHALAIAVDDRRYRIRNLGIGEVAVYDHTGTSIVLKENGDIDLTPSSGTVNLTGSLNVSGDVAADGDVTAGPISLNSHIHSGTALIPTVGGTPGTIAGVTGGPS